MSSGQVTGLIGDLPSCAELIESIVGDAVKHLQAAAALVE
jgi:NAD(P)H-dependent flavin oxidoreductase YrpB (nitropropane dioxygenase family)